MIPVERRQIILEMVAEKGIVSIAELTDRMNVSHMTIRRDLQKLEQQGAVVLVSGGVQSPGRVAHEPSHQVKTALAMTQKAAIGKLAASLVQPGRCIYLDAGTTAHISDCTASDSHGAFAVNLSTTSLLRTTCSTTVIARLLRTWRRSVSGKPFLCWGSRCDHAA